MEGYRPRVYLALALARLKDCQHIHKRCLSEGYVMKTSFRKAYASRTIIPFGIDGVVCPSISYHYYINY